MMFEGEDRQTLQSLINNGTITPENQRTPQLALDVISTTIKSKEHFWHFWDELSDICQLPDKGIHALSTRITNLIAQCKFPHAQTQQMFKSWFCNTPCNAMRPETGSGFRTSPSSSVKSFLPHIGCLSHNMSSTKR